MNPPPNPLPGPGKPKKKRIRKPAAERGRAAFDALNGQSYEKLSKAYETQRGKNTQLSRALRFVGSQYQTGSIEDMELVAIEKLNRSPHKPQGVKVDRAYLATMFATLSDAMKPRKLSYTKFLEIVLLDDFWSSVGSVLRGVGRKAVDIGYQAASNFMPLAGPALNVARDWLHEQLGDKIPPTDPPAMSGDFEGGSNLNNLTFYNSQYLIDSYNSKAVNKQALATWLYPEMYLNRFPDPYLNESSGITRFVYEIDLVTNASGNAGFYLQPHAYNANAITSGGNAYYNWFLLALNGASFDPNTGAQTATYPVGYTGPYFTGNVATCGMRNGLLVGCAVDITNIGPYLTSRGTVELLQYKTALNASFGEVSSTANLTPVLTRAAMANQPYYQLRTLATQAGNSLVRSVWVPSDPVDQSYEDYNSAYALGGSLGSNETLYSYVSNDGFYILITGAIGSTAVARMKVSLVYQFHPIDTIASLIGQENAGPGAQTRLLQSQLSKAMPVVTFCSVDESRAMVQRSFSTKSVDVDDVLNTILEVPIGAQLNAASSGFTTSSNVASMSTRPPEPREDEKVGVSGLRSRDADTPSLESQLRSDSDYVSYLNRMKSIAALKP